VSILTIKPEDHMHTVLTMENPREQMQRQDWDLVSARWMRVQALD
jgi:hypothetical protein